MTSAEFMDPAWQKFVDTNVNTVLGCVTWEDIEPVEDQFHFAELDKVILDARKHGLHLVLLWFGSFKNGISTYVPPWVKTNTKRFPRAKLRQAGGVLKTGDVLSIFHEEGPKADAKAFGRFLSHLKEVDSAHSTVLMVQVENETGLLGDSRDGSAAAEKRFNESVPLDLLHFLAQDWDNLHTDLKANLTHLKSQTNPSGTWTQVFGQGPRTSFSWLITTYAKYVTRVATAGKQAHPLYTNVWQNYVDVDGDNDFPVVVGGGSNPGDYPSGGGTSNVLDIWQRFAPSLDFIAPDVYLNDYNSSCRKYRHRNQPLIIPEQRRDEYGARRIWVAYGSYQAMGVFPFGIDTQVPATNPFTRHYGLLQSVAPLVLEAQTRPDSSVGFCFNEIPGEGGSADSSKPVARCWGGYEITIERCFVFGKPGPGAGMVICLGGARFLLIGWGFQVRARALSPTTSFTGFLRFRGKVGEQRNGGTAYAAGAEWG